MKIISKNLKKDQNGFSLVEIILYMGILSVLIIALFQLLTAIFDVQLESQSTSSVSADAQFILNRFEYDISRADSINFPDVGTQSQTLMFGEGSSTYTYTLQNENLILIASPSGTQDQLNSFNTKVTGLNFQRLSDSAGDLNSVTIDFTLESEVQRSGGVEIKSFRTTAGTR